jgi:polysaccharide biosynthesis transport protein
MADLNKNITLIPEYQSKLDQIDREITAARQLRDQFKVQQEGFQISQKLLNQSRIDLIEEARVPFKPVSPNKNKLIVMGVILGLALGGATILMVELFDNSVKQIGWVEDDLNLKVIGTIPKVTWTKMAEKKHSRKAPTKK